VTDLRKYTTCLQIINALPFTQTYKQKSYDRLNLQADSAVLDVGCGLGAEAIAIAGRLGPKGRVVGLDVSATLIEAARQAVPANPKIEFVVGDAHRLSFPDATFDACRVDRALQHMRAPLMVLQEMTRVLKPGGMLLAYDNDWDTFIVDAADAMLTRRILDVWTNSFAHGRVGRQLYAHFRACGFSRIAVSPETLTVGDLEAADRVYDLRETLHKAVVAGAVSDAEARAWLADLTERQKKGLFFCSSTAFMVWGSKPAMVSG